MSGACDICESMRRAAACVRLGLSVCLVALGGAWAPAAVAQELPRVSATRPLVVEGISVDARVPDLLGLGRIHFQGLIAAELSAIGYRVAPAGSSVLGDQGLTLVGSVKEEICDDLAPSQCRVAIQWELQDHHGVVGYRTTTRAVDQQASLEKLRRGLIQGALHSLLGRRRFALRLTDEEARGADPAAGGTLGFKQCLRPALTLPQASRALAASVVLVESGSNLFAGAILSGDGLIVTSARGIERQAPLRVRFSARQVLPARVVALDSNAAVALLHVEARTDGACLAIHSAAPKAGDVVFGVSSALSEDVALSLSGSLVQNVSARGASRLLQVDARIARSEGAPLLDEQGELVAVVVHDGNVADGSASALPLELALGALAVRPAPITDPRLLGARTEPAPAIGYVRDPDDPSFVLTKRYTYGTSDVAHGLRSAGFIGAGVGAAGVALSWFSFHSSREISQSERDKIVFWNDLSWIALGLGAAGIGASFVWPESHEVVDAHSSARRELSFGVALNGVAVRGSL